MTDNTKPLRIWEGFHFIYYKNKDYPTVRLRLDRLIQKIKISETAEADPYVSLVKRLAVEDKLDFDTAKILITEYRRAKEAE